MNLNMENDKKFVLNRPFVVTVLSESQEILSCILGTEHLEKQSCGEMRRVCRDA